MKDKETSRDFWRNDGTIKLREFYDGNIVVRRMCFRHDETLMLDYTLYKNGNIKCRKFYRDDGETLNWAEHYRKGKLEWRHHYRPNTSIEWVEKYENGELKQRGYFRPDKTQERTDYFRDGSIICVVIRDEWGRII